MFLFGRKLLPSGGGQFVIARLAIVVLHAPLCLDQSVRFQSVKRWIKRSLLDVQNVFRHLMDPVRDSESMSRVVLERFQNHDLERSANEIGFFLGPKSCEA